MLTIEMHHLTAKGPTNICWPRAPFTGTGEAALLRATLFGAIADLFADPDSMGGYRAAARLRDRQDAMRWLPQPAQVSASAPPISPPTRRAPASLWPPAMASRTSSSDLTDAFTAL
jgi:hypothetical protein